MLRSIHATVMCLFSVVLWPSLAVGARVQVRFDVASPSESPFPSDLFTVADANQNTGRRVNLPLPDCGQRPSDCDDLAAINTLDGFNLQPRLSVPFTAPIDVATVTSETVFLISLGSTLPGGNSAGKVVGINQVVWDTGTNTLHAESDELLDQHTRYALIVTRGVRDPDGGRVGVREFTRLRRSLRQAPDFQSYRADVREAIGAARKALRAQPVKIGRLHFSAVSVFTTQSATATLEQIRDQIKAEIPAAADFLLGAGGFRTVFPLGTITDVTVRLHARTDLSHPAAFVEDHPPLLALDGLSAGAVAAIAFGKFLSPDYKTSGEIIPPSDTASGTPAVQRTDELFLTLFLPSGQQPPGGWPVAIYGHGSFDYKDGSPYVVAAIVAAQGIATLAITAVGQGGGPLGELTVSRTDGEPVTFPSGGRATDQDGCGIIAIQEGDRGNPPWAIISNRDALRQTVVDLMQLVRVIEVGMDVDGDGQSDLDPSRMYYFGDSLGGNYGTMLLALESNVRAGVLTVAGGSYIEFVRLSPVNRIRVSLMLLARVPSLINIGGFAFNENMPLRNQPAVINDVPGAMEIQEYLERAEWIQQPGSPVAYAPHLRKQPLDGMTAKPVLIQFAKGDQNVPNPTNTAIIRAGELTDRTTYFRNDLAFADPVRNPTGAEVPKNPHEFLFPNPFTAPAVFDIGVFAQEQIATFLATDGAEIVDPDGDGPLFEVPIGTVLPEELNFIP